MTPFSVEWWPSGGLGAFVLFILPVGPGKAAGILTGKNGGLDALAILTLYLLSDIVAAFYLEPAIRLARRFGPRYAWARAAGEQLAALAARVQLGTSRPARLATLVLIGFGASRIVGAMTLALTPIGRPLGWAAVIAGDLVWFSFLLAAALGLASVIPDDRLVFVCVVALAMLGGPIARRLGLVVPASRPSEATAPRNLP